MDIANILRLQSESFFLPDRIWDIICDLFEIWLHIDHLLSDPRSWDIVHIRVYRHDLLPLRGEVLDLTARKRESTILVLRLPEYEYAVSLGEIREYLSLVEPYGFRMHTITICEYCFDEEFLISRHFMCEKLDPTLDRLLLDDIHERELRHDITLILVLFREIGRAHV